MTKQNMTKTASHSCHTYSQIA